MAGRNRDQREMGKLEQVGQAMRIVLLHSTGLMGLIAATAAQAGALPSGGSVAAGSATIATIGSTTTITQTSQNAVINWASFSVGAGNSVVFHDASSAGATLNRVTGSATSVIAGQITSNGAVYLVNPNGIVITSTGSVDTAGGFVASTLDLADADFLAGRLNFKGHGASALVSNAGRISAGQGAYVALLGGAVANSGTITVPLGKLGLGSGEQIALDINGGNFMQVAVPTSLITGSNALVSNSGEIVVSDGAVQLKAAVLKDAVRNVINMSGSISADSAVGNGGSIQLIGGADTGSLAGQVTVSGTLSARATGASGNGGAIETSGEHVDLNGASVSTTSAHGAAGTWLIDPVDFTVADSGGDMTGTALTTALTQGNVIIASSQGASGTDGDITINSAVNWSAHTLTLDAYRNINVNAVMRATGTAGFVGITGDTGGDGTSTGGALNFGLGASGFYGRLDLAATGSFALNGNVYTIITTLGAAGSTTGTDLQGINGNLSGYYVLGTSLDATATSGWNNGTGFTALGTDGAGNIWNGSAYVSPGWFYNQASLPAGGFTGQFVGLGHTVNNLWINQVSGGYTGLFGWTAGGISNVGVVGGHIINNFNVSGGLAGINAGTISNAYASANLSGTPTNGGLFGGLVGENFGTITDSYATGPVSATGGYALGGLAGDNSGTITGSYATGNVSGVDIGGDFGGLVGENSGTITNAYATGNVSGGGDYVGGLVGNNQAGGITAAYATGSVSGTHDVGGLVGDNNNGGTITAAYATGSVSGILSVGGLVGYNLGTITTAYATGSAAGQALVGGLVGYNNDGYITDAYASGRVMGTNAVGGLVGDQIGTIATSYWDSYSSGQANAVGGGWATGITAITSDPTQAGASNYAFSAGAYSFTTPANWVLMNGVRPMGVWEEAPVIGGISYISNAHQLQLINASNAMLAGHYVLTGDIDLSGTGTVGTCTAAANCTPASYAGMWGAAGFVPIGTDGAGGVRNGGNTFTAGFTGSLDGGGHTVANLYINRSANYVGLFGFAGNHSSLSNVGVVNANVTGAGIVGLLAGEAQGSVIANAYSTGIVWGVFDAGGLVGSLIGTISGSSSSANVSGNEAVGGLLGFSNSATISNSHATGTVTGSGSNVGGLVGASYYGTITSSYATGSVTGDQNVGGLVGIGDGDTAISNAYATGAVTGNIYVGGLVGDTEYASTISKSYATGTVTGTSAWVGGLVGVAHGTTAISDSYATGDVSGYGGVGGLVGELDGTMDRSYATGRVTGSSYWAEVGGLVGDNSGSITNSYATGDVTSGGGLVGGLVGQNTGAISTSYATGNVMGTGGYADGGEVGGLIGGNFGTVSNVYATGNVIDAGGYSGGLAGINAGTIANAYATGSVTEAGADVGGLVGANIGGITNTYATGAVSGGSAGTIGGLVGVNQWGGQVGTITNSFYNRQTSGQTQGIGDTADAAGAVMGLTTAQMMMSASFTGWSMDSVGGQNAVWRIYAGQTAPLLKSFLTAAYVTTDASATRVVYNGLNQMGAITGTVRLADGSAADAGQIHGAATGTCSGGDASCIHVGSYSLAVSGGLYSGQQGYDLIYVPPASTTATLTITALGQNLAPFLPGVRAGGGTAHQAAPGTGGTACEAEALSASYRAAGQISPCTAG